MAMYCLCWKLVYLASCDCIMHIYWGITVYYVLWLHLAVYICILFVSPVTYLLIRWWIWSWNIPLPKSFIKICIWYLIIQSSKQSWAILIQKDSIALLCSRYLACIITLTWKNLSLSLSGKQNKISFLLPFFFQYNVACRYFIWFEKGNNSVWF